MAEAETAPDTSETPATTAPAGSQGQKATAEEAAALSPMMAQYHEIRSAYPDCLLFYRMGDFYELFFEDAEEAAQSLDIALTRRIQQGKVIPMAGVPAASHEGYLARLIRAGHKVAVCEQLEDPQEARRKRGSKAMVAREVIRVVTPGTLTEDSLLEAKAPNYLAAVAKAGDSLGLAWVDVSTGAVAAQPVSAEPLGAALARIAPGELLVPDSLVEAPVFQQARPQFAGAVTVQAQARFDSRAGERRLQELYDVAALDSFGNFSRGEIAALGALIGYVELTQRGQLPRLERPQRVSEGAVMAIDQATRRNLELTRTLGGERKGSLLGTVDRTVTGPGARLLAERLAAPLTDPDAIQGRQAAVAAFAREGELRGKVRNALKACPDGQRALSRLSLGRGGPRDLAAIRDMLVAARTIADALGGLASDVAGTPPAVGETAGALTGLEELGRTLTDALAPDLPMLARDGGFIAEGYDAALGEWRDLRDNARRKIAALQQRYVQETGISSLKIRHNNVLGYFVEVTPTNADKLPTEASGGEFIHRQSLANAVRFTTVELAELARNIAEAAERSLGRELTLFDDLVGQVLAASDALGACASALASLDVAAALGELATAQGWARPEVDGSRAFAVSSGRHPVVEAALERDGAAFVANDCDLSPGQRLWLLTGPNMAGKSTFLRQNALIAVLAQAGSFVPAQAAHLGVVDRLFSRVGAADDLASGRSTFMVEMVETATILNQASDRSLVILDEIGRGTATYDGLALAWAVVEHLHDVNRARALFATHYHEMTRLQRRLGDLACHTMRVREWQGRIVFLHEVAAGAAESSYGLHVARLAGLPPAVLDRAEAVLNHLESEGGGNADDLDDLPLFQAMQPAAGSSTGAGSQDATPARDPNADAALEALRATDPDGLTPRQALETLYALQAKLAGGGEA